MTLLETERRISGIYSGDKYLGQPNLNDPFRDIPSGLTYVGACFEKGRFVRWLNIDELDELRRPAKWREQKTLRGFIKHLRTRSTQEGDNHDGTE